MEKICEIEFIQLLNEVIQPEEEIKIDSTFDDHVFDSMVKLLLVSAFEEKYNVQISAEEMLQCKTVKDLLELL